MLKTISLSETISQVEQRAKRQNIERTRVKGAQTHVRSEETNHGKQEELI